VNGYKVQYTPAKNQRDKKAHWLFGEEARNKFLAFATSFNALWFENFRDLKGSCKKSLNKRRMAS